MLKRSKKKPVAVRVIKPGTTKPEGAGAILVPGVTDEDPNTGRRIEKKKKK